MPGPPLVSVAAAAQQRATLTSSAAAPDAVVVVPGAAYISMAMSAVVEMHGRPPVFALEDLIFPTAMVLPDAKKGRPAQIVFTSDAPEADFTLYSLNTDDIDDIDEDSWVTHEQEARGRPVWSQPSSKWRMSES